MRNEERIVSYSFEELRAMEERGEDRTDWARVKAMTDEEIEANIDIEDEGDFSMAYITTEPPMEIAKRQLTIRLDDDILEWFRSGGPGYQTRINWVLRQYVEEKKKSA